MPSVKPYEQQVRDEAAPNARNQQQVSPNDFGAGLADQAVNAAQQIAAAHENVVRAEKDKQRSAGTMEAYTRLSDADSQIREGYQAMQGKNAMTSYETTLKNFEERVQDIGSDISDPQVRATFEKMVVERRDQFTRFVNEHHSAQGDVVAKQALNGVLSTSARDAASYAGAVSEYDARASSTSDPLEREKYTRAAAHFREQIQRSIDIGQAALSSEANRAGVDPTAALLDQSTKAHVAVVNELVKSDPAAAAKYLDDHGDEIEPAMLSKAKGVVGEENAKVQAMALEEKLVRDAKGDPTKVVEAAMKLPKETRERVLDLHDARQRRVEAARVEFDKPLIASLKHGFLTQGVKPQGGVYGKLSIGGKTTIDEWWQAEKAKAAGGEGAKAIEKRDRTIKSRFRALDLTNSAGNDQTTVQIVGNPLFDGASEEALNTMTLWQKNARRDVQNDTGVSRGEFTRSVDRDMLSTGHKRGTPFYQSYSDNMQDRWDEWRADTANDALKRPPKELTDSWKAEANEILVQEHWYGDSEMPAHRVETLGLTGYKPAGKPAVIEKPAAAPAAATKAKEPPAGWLRLVNSDGTKMMAWDPSKATPEGWAVIP